MDALVYEGRHRVGVVAELPGLLRRFGLEPASVVAQAGLEPSLLDDPENRISFHALGLLLDLCASATGRPDFGLLLGAQGGTKSLGVIGRLMRNAPTLGQALFDICANQQRYISGAVAYLVVRNGTAYWGYGVHIPGTPAVGQICDGALGVAAKVLRELVGRAPELVLISRPAPRDGALYREVFGSAIQFDAEQHAFAFPASWLSLPVLGAEPALRRDTELLVEDYWARICPGFVERTIRTLRSRVVCGNASLDAVAEALSLTPRTLNRRLSAEGRTFRQLANEARFVVAQQLLAGTRMPVTSVALALGYADASAFTHAFQRTVGLAPSEWRAKLRADDGEAAFD
ncbi:AraC family transcriptional regulator [Rhodoblastus sp.]|uniref:AraC family transcriptional regulator n=3 Tax=Rhodoblastus sp. TaxID=1962975 RepID=UPI003F9A6504